MKKQNNETAQGDALEESHKDDPKAHGLTPYERTELERNIQRLDLNESLEVKRSKLVCAIEKNRETKTEKLAMFWASTAVSESIQEFLNQ